MKRIVLFIFLLALTATAAAGDVYFVTRVIDGDTIKVQDMYGMGQTVRLIGIDAPECTPGEKAQYTARTWGVSVADVVSAGEAARHYLRARLPPSTRIRLVTDGRGADDYGRVLAHVYTQAGECLNETLVRNGYALVFRREDFTRRSAFVELERAARTDRVNFWNTVWKNIKER